MDWKQRCEELENRISELEAENRELRRKLGMCDPKPVKPIPTTAVHHHSTPAEKIQLFRSLFRGREDVFARRWYSIKTEKAGYAPVCANEWKSGVCIKPKGTCSKCDHRELVPLSAQVIYNHLSGTDAYGRDVVGLYPIFHDDTCFFLAIDFDDGTWQENVSAVRHICTEWNIPCAVERSRSGEGASMDFLFGPAPLLHRPEAGQYAPDCRYGTGGFSEAGCL